LGLPFVDLAGRTHSRKHFRFPFFFSPLPRWYGKAVSDALLAQPSLTGVENPSSTLHRCICFISHFCLLSLECGMSWAQLIDVGRSSCHRFLALGFLLFVSGPSDVTASQASDVEEEEEMTWSLMAVGIGRDWLLMYTRWRDRGRLVSSSSLHRPSTTRFMAPVASSAACGLAVA